MTKGKKKNTSTETNGLMEKISTIFKFYLEGITVLFLFLPGILYQIHFLGADISQYTGLSIILFLAISFYYSLPFISAGIFIRMIEEGKKNFDKNKHSSFAIGLFAVVVYFASFISPVWLDFVNKFVDISSPYILTDTSLESFWGRFFVITILFLGMVFVDKYIHKK